MSKTNFSSRIISSNPHLLVILSIPRNEDELREEVQQLAVVSLSADTNIELIFDLKINWFPEKLLIVFALFMIEVKCGLHSDI